MSAALAKSIQKSAGKDSGIRVGTVVSVQSSTALTVNVGGAQITDMPYVSSYGPSAGDTVQIVRMDATWLVVGLVGPPRGSNVVDGVVAQGSTTVTTSGTAESNLDFLNTGTLVQLYPGRIYEPFIYVFTQQSVATDYFEFRWRRDNDFSTPGAEIGFRRFSNGSAIAGVPQSCWGILEVDTPQAIPFFWSVIRVTGTGTITCSPKSGSISSYSKLMDQGTDTSVTGSVWKETTG